MRPAETGDKSRAGTSFFIGVLTGGMCCNRSHTAVFYEAKFYVVPFLVIFPTRRALSDECSVGHGLISRTTLDHGGEGAALEAILVSASQINGQDAEPRPLPHTESFQDAVTGTGKRMKPGDSRQPQRSTSPAQSPVYTTVEAAAGQSDYAYGRGSYTAGVADTTTDLTRHVDWWLHHRSNLPAVESHTQLCPAGLTSNTAVFSPCGDVITLAPCGRSSKQM
ncbi:hypothetical protein Bbelb_375430 [Branchiostoma belcheri]|nr:hypothetical protein Bbelb_375430 [Branchiostoma belcheri]